MRQEIEQRINSQIEFSQKQNAMFDVVVSVIDKSVATTTFDGLSEFKVNDDDCRYVIQSNEDIIYGNGSIYLYIDDITSNTRLASLTVNVNNGTVIEDYHTMPRSKRAMIFGLFGDIIDMVDEYMNTPETDEE